MPKAIHRRSTSQAVIPTATRSPTRPAACPPGVTLDPDSGLISGQISPTAANASPYTVTATISDGIQAHNVSQTFSWTITHLGLTNPGNQANVNGDTVSLQLQANDVDGDILTYGVATGSALPPQLSLDARTGRITGQLTSDADRNSPYTVSVTASDGVPGPGHTVTQTFTWTVAHLSFSNPGNQANAENDTIINFQLQGHDADGETLTYNDNHTLPTGLSIVGNVIQGQIQPNVQTGSHVYPVTITASDGNPAHNVSQTFTWTVTHVLLASPGDQNTGDGDAVSLQLHAHDNDDPSLTYTATGLPPGLAINAGTGLISGTMAANADANSPYTVTVTADDANPAHLVSQTFTWSAFPHVQVTSPNDRRNADGDTVNLPIQALDPEDGDPLTYSDTSSGNHTLPPGLAIDPATGLISGMLAANADVNSPYTVTITATDTNGNYSARQTFRWTVSPVGLVNPGTQYSAAGDNLVAGSSLTPPLQLQGRGSNLMYKVSQTNPLPLGLSLDQHTGLITGTIDPNADAGSPYTVTVTATDGNQHTASQTFTWVVTHVGLVNPGAQTNVAGDNLVPSDSITPALQLQGRDADGEQLTYTASLTNPLPPGLTLSSSGLITGQIATNADANSPYTVTVIATDTAQHSTSQTFTWTVLPRVTMTPPGDQLSADGDAVTLQIAANDARGRHLTYTLTGQPPGLNIDPNTGLITGPVGANDDVSSPYLVTVTASDDKVSVSQQFLWSVAHILVTPPGDQSSVDDQTIAPLAIQARHSDTTAVTYTATGLPPNLSIDQNTAVISGKISHTADAGSPYTVTVQATEGGYSAGQTFTWTVSPLTTNAPANQSHVAGSTVSLPIRVRYSGTAPLRFSATGLPPGLAIDRLTGVISGRITPASVWRRYNVAVRATDGVHPSGAAFTWTVLPPGNPPPTITNPGNQVNNEDDTIALPIKASDPDGDPLTYSAAGLPSGLSIDPTTGWITGSLDDTAFSDTPFRVTVTVDDGNGNTASQTFNWLFEAPALTASPMSVAPLEGVEFSGMVATFSNANVGSSEFADEYNATIDWGDGSPLDTGSVTGANGAYSVFGDHLYKAIATRPVTVTITDENLASVTVTSTANVGDAPVTAAPVPVSLLARDAATVVPVATFTDLNPYDPITSYAATIAWGDSTSSPGTISGLNGKFVVSGNHAGNGYLFHGSYAVVVTIMQNGTMVASTSSPATVGDYYEGQFNLYISGFTDNDPNDYTNDIPPNYISTVQWQDGSPPDVSNRTTSQDARTYGLFNFSENHTFAPGVYNNITVTISDRGGMSITATAPRTLYIAERPLKVYTAPIYATAGVPLNNATVALVTDPDPNGSASAAVDWGDGSSGPATVAVLTTGLLQVNGAHTYTQGGLKALELTLLPTGGPIVPAVMGVVAGLNYSFVVRPKIGRLQAASGTLLWKLAAPQPYATGVDFEVFFTPDKMKCKASTITFLQVATEATIGANNGVYAKEFYRQFSIRNKPGSGLDFVEGETDPYYGAMWDPNQGKQGEFVPETNPRIQARVGNGPAGRIAHARDHPHDSRAFPFGRLHRAL
jgi:hypothetical protein